MAQTTSTSTTTTNASTAQNPTITLVNGDANWELVGCYNELPNIATGRALGLNGSYISPILSSPDALTVALCLEGCRVALSPNGGEYTYAGVENSVECYCGLTISPFSTLQGRVYCSSPCAADPSTSCGGNGYLTLYERRSALNATSTTISPSSSLVPTQNSISTVTPIVSSTPVPTKKPLPMTLIWVGIALGLLLLALFVAFLLFLEKRLHVLCIRRRAMDKLALTIKDISTPPQATSFIGSSKFSQPNSATMSRTRSGHAVPIGRRFGIVGEAGVAVTPLPPLVQPSGTGIGFEFEFQTEAAGKRRRDTFEAWKRGVVPPVKSEDVVQKENLDMFGAGRGKIAKELELGDIGRSFIASSGTTEEEALPKTPKTPEKVMAGFSRVNDGVDLCLDFGMGSENEGFDRRDAVKGNESDESPALGISKEEEAKPETALEESESWEGEAEETGKGRN